MIFKNKILFSAGVCFLVGVLGLLIPWVINVTDDIVYGMIRYPFDSLIWIGIILASGYGATRLFQLIYNMWKEIFDDRELQRQNERERKERYYSNRFYSTLD